MNKLADNAADTARNLNADNEDTADTADTGNDNGIAEILGTPAGPETEATAMLMISLGIALNPRARSTNRRKAAATLRRVGRGLDRTRPHPVEMLAADLLDNMQKEADQSLMNLLIIQARQARAGIDQAGTALEALAPAKHDRGTYHTAEPAATLMARLCVPEERDWSIAATPKGLKIADYACGAGALLTAAYQRVRELHQAAGGNPAVLHQHMMHHCITGTDISPAAVALTTEALARMEPRMNFTKTRIGRMPYGPEGPDRKPALGALDLLFEDEMPTRTVNAVNRAGSGEPMPPDAWGPRTQDVVLMNPPFSRPIRHHVLDQHAGARPGRQSTAGELVELRRRLEKLTQRYGASPGIGAAYPMAILALRNTASNGRVGLIIPLTALSGSSRHGGGWQNFRDSLLTEFNNITVLSTAAYGNEGNSFSNTTTIAEALITARRLREGETPDHTVMFVNLNRTPADNDEARTLAQAVLERQQRRVPGETRELNSGKEPHGHATCRTAGTGETWDGARKLDPGLAETAREIAAGQLGGAPTTPMCTLGELANVGGNSKPGPVRTPGPRGKPRRNEVWVLHRRDCRHDTKMNARQPEVAGTRPRATKVRQRQAPLSKLHVSSNMRFNSQPTAACITRVPALGGNGWPAADTKDPRTEKALAVWLNSTLGLICLWAQSNLTQNGLGFCSTKRLRELPVLDPRRLSEKQMTAITSIFDDMSDMIMRPASEAWEDPVRNELDRRLIENVLDATEVQKAALAAARARWCLEPTVQGRKGHTKPQAKNMERLRKADGEAHRNLQGNEGSRAGNANAGH